MENNIRSLVEGFAQQIVAAIEEDSARRVQDALSITLGDNAGSARRGRPARAAAGRPAASSPTAPVRHRPKQFCPVPGCSGVAAPVFGMVCAKHKDLPKARIDEYRVRRRAAKTSKK